MLPDRSQLDARIVDVENALAAGSDPDRTRELRVELATALATRFAKFGGSDADRLRAEQIAEELLADAATTPRQRHALTVLLPVLTMLSATPAAALRDRGPTLDAEALERTEQWRRDNADPRTVLAGLGRLTEQLDAVDLAELPPEVRWAMEMTRTMSGLLENLQQPGWNGEVPAEIVDRLRDATADPPPGAEAVELARGLAVWLDAGRAPETALESAIAGLAVDDLLRPVLQGDLARALARRADADALGRVTDLLEQARAGMAEDHPMREETEWMLAGALVATAAADRSAASVAAAEELATRLLTASATADDPARHGANLFLGSLIGLLRGLGGGSRDLRAALQDLVGAIESLPPGHALLPIAIGQLGGVLADRHLMNGLLADGAAAISLLRRAVAAVAAGADPVDAAILSGLVGVARLGRAMRTADTEELDAAAALLRNSLSEMPAGHVMRPNLEVVSAIADLATAGRAGTGHRQAVQRLRATLSGTAPVGIPPALVATLTDICDVLTGLLDSDPSRTRQAIDRMEAGIDGTAAFPHQAAGQHALVSKAYLAADGVPDAAGRAVAHLRRARELIGDRGADVVRIDVLGDLAVALRADGDRLAARRAALDQLMTYAAVVLLQSGVSDALSTARGAVDDADRLMRWCLSDGDPAGAVEALELGRGLTLHAATTTSQVPGLLAGTDEAALADAWRRAAGARPPEDPDFAEAADDIRHRVLDALRGTREGRRLFIAPSATSIGRALQTLGRDALAYLVPGGPTAEGVVLVLDRTGRITAHPAPGLRLDAGDPLADYLRILGSGELGTPGAWRTALERLCSWAGDAAIPPLLAALGELPGSGPDGTRRLVLVPCGPLGAVPWPAVHVPTAAGGVRYACQEFVLSTAASARQLRDVAARPVLPVDAAPVLVSGPAPDLSGVQDEVAALAGAVYPGAAVLGHDSDPDDVLARFTGGHSIIHVGCHATATGSLDTSRLDLASPLSLRAILEHARGRRADVGGPTVVLAACDSDLTRLVADEALTLATGLLAAGAATVVGTRWAVSDGLTAVAVFALHHHLAVAGLPAADALRATQLWLLDPAREPLPGMPPKLRSRARHRALGDTSVWAAFGHSGW